jgi:hypothetical protein
LVPIAPQLVRLDFFIQRNLPAQLRNAYQAVVFFQAGIDAVKRREIRLSLSLRGQVAEELGERGTELRAVARRSLRRVFRVPAVAQRFFEVEERSVVCPALT